MGPPSRSPKSSARSAARSAILSNKRWSVKSRPRNGAGIRGTRARGSPRSSRSASPATKAAERNRDLGGREELESHPEEGGSTRDTRDPDPSGRRDAGSLPRRERHRDFRAERSAR